jgi:NAD+ synthase
MSSNIDSIVESLLAFDKDAEIEKITLAIRKLLREQLRRRGLVLGISGGIDSAVCAALAVRAVGADKVFALLMPERDSSSESVIKGKMMTAHLGIEYIVQDIAPTLEAAGCYRWRDEAMQAVFPDYRSDWKSKIVIGGGQEGRINYFKLVVADTSGKQYEERLPLKEYLQVVAATNFKQRTRKMFEFFHADRLNYAVIGTPNRVEYDQGFFVKNGDGAADIKPIAHLYKSQVYMLARHMGLPEEICTSIPSTDTYSLSQGQDEFYYSLPYREMDVALWYHNHGKSAADLAHALNLTPERAEFVLKDIDSKRRTTAQLHWPALLIESVIGPHTKPGFFD